MTRSNWIALSVVAVTLILIIYFRAEILYGIGTFFTWIGIAALFLWNVVAAAVGWILTLLGVALTLATSALQLVAAIFIVIAVAIVGISVLAQLSLQATDFVSKKFGETAKQMRELRTEFRIEAGRAARDAAFLALIATSSALIAYMGTDDFLKQVSTIRFLAIGCIGLVLSKIFLFFPSRIPKWFGIVLTVVILAGSLGFVAIKYKLADGTMNGFVILHDVLIEPENQLKLLLATIIGMFSLLTLLFPFTPSEWRQLLVVAQPQSDHAVIPAIQQQEPALLGKSDRV